MKRNYYNSEQFAKHVAAFVVGYHYINKEAITFKQVAEYLNITSDAIRMKTNDKNNKIHKELEKFNIKCKRDGRHNVFYLDID